MVCTDQISSLYSGIVVVVIWFVNWAYISHAGLFTTQRMLVTVRTDADYSAASLEYNATDSSLDIPLSHYVDSEPTSPCAIL